MRAVCWHSANQVGVETVADATVINPRDVVVRVSVSGICGSDLHLYHGLMPAMERGDIIGHEFCGEVVATGAKVHNIRGGDRVVVPSVIGCGNCFHCRRQEWSLCDNSNPNARLAERTFGFATSGIYGYSHLYGGYAGSDAEYVRVPFADVGAKKIPDGVSDEQACFASDAFSTGMMAAEMCSIQPGDTVAVWGAGPVGQCAMMSAYLLGAERVIAIDRVQWRLNVAERYARAETLNYERVDPLEALTEMTGGRGPDACIDAVGMESHGRGFEALVDRSKRTFSPEMDGTDALRQAIAACRKGGTVAFVGAYLGSAGNIPLGTAMNKALTLRTGQQHGHKYIPVLLEAMAKGAVDPSYLVTHRMPLEDADLAFRMFDDKADDCLKILFYPSMRGQA